MCIHILLSNYVQLLYICIYIHIHTYFYTYIYTYIYTYYASILPKVFLFEVIQGFYDQQYADAPCQVDYTTCKDLPADCSECLPEDCSGAR